jgi:hypothetical protein
MPARDASGWDVAIDERPHTGDRAEEYGIETLRVFISLHRARVSHLAQ